MRFPFLWLVIIWSSTTAPKRDCRVPIELHVHEVLGEVWKTTLKEQCKTSLLWHARHPHASDEGSKGAGSGRCQDVGAHCDNRNYANADGLRDIATGSRLRHLPGGFMHERHNGTLQRLRRLPRDPDVLPVEEHASVLSMKWLCFCWLRCFTISIDNKFLEENKIKKYYCF